MPEPGYTRFPRWLVRIVQDAHFFSVFLSSGRSCVVLNDAIFVALLFRGGREGAEAPQIFHPGAGVEICGDLARFPNCKDAFIILANSISRTPALLKYY